jgi:hypothetical protein
VDEQMKSIYEILKNGKEEEEILEEQVPKKEEEGEKD